MKRIEHFPDFINVFFWPSFEKKSFSLRLDKPTYKFCFWNIIQRIRWNEDPMFSSETIAEIWLAIGWSLESLFG